MSRQIRMLIAALVVCCFGIVASLALSSFSLGWERFDFGNSTQEEQARIVERKLSEAIPDSIVSRLQSVSLDHCTLVITTNYLRNCSSSLYVPNIMASEKTYDLTELSDNVARDVTIRLNPEYGYSFVIWQFVPEIGRILFQLSPKAADFPPLSSSVEIRERADFFSNKARQGLWEAGIKTHGVDQICMQQDQFRIFDDIWLSIRPTSAEEIISVLATYKENFCAAN